MKLESEKLNEFHQIEKPSQRERERERERESKLVQYYAWFEPSSQNWTRSRLGPQLEFGLALGIKKVKKAMKGEMEREGLQWSWWGERERERGK